MRNSTDIIAQVVNGYGPKLASVLEVSPSRCYEILSTDNPLPKLKRLIRAIAQVNKEGVYLIWADLDSMFHDLLGDDARPGCPNELRRESFEAINAVSDDKPKAVQKRELLEQLAVITRLLRDLDAPELKFNGNGILPPEIKAEARRRKG